MLAVAALMVGCAGNGAAAQSPVPSPLSPPTDASWTRSGANPILSPTGREGAWILEPTVLYESGTFKMIYTTNNGNWSSPAMQFGYATSRDGGSWTKYGANPIFGMGVGGESGTVNQPELLKLGSTYYLYYTGQPGARRNVATSTDLVTWSIAATNILALPGSVTSWNNSTVVSDSGTLKMLVEGYTGSVWEVFYATSSDALHWTIGNGGHPLTTLQIAPGGMYGGPFLWPVRVGGLWQLWYHASPVAGQLPTNIYHATSPDLTTWTKTTPSPVLTHAGSGIELDQVADPSIVIAGTTAYMFYDGDDNVTLRGAIGLATAPAIMPR
jgi:hypothetical protein